MPGNHLYAGLRALTALPEPAHQGLGRRFRYRRRARHPVPSARLAKRTDNKWDAAIYLAASPGGHIHLLRSVLDGLAGHPRVWVTADGAHCNDLRDSGERVLTLPRVKGVGLVRSLIGMAESGLLAVRERPRVVITSGADLVIPFAMVARLLGARLYYIESSTRVRTESLSGRIVGRWCERHFVQWPELAGRANTIRVWPETLEDLPDHLPRQSGTGTFVTVGTHTADYSRLIGAACRASEAGILPQPVTVQYGFSNRPRSRAVNAVQWLTADEVREHYAASALVVTHAGSGSILGALLGGLRPIAMPRRERFNEHVDDHQVELVEKFEALDLLVPVENEISAGTVEATLRTMTVPRRPDDVPTLVAALYADLSADTKLSARGQSGSDAAAS